MHKVLQGLWDCGVKAILDVLGFTQTPPPDHPWPRIWWVGSGLLKVLPIHASGYHDTDPPQTVLDRVISSYAFTVKSLSYAQERAARAQFRLSTNAILFGMPTTPDEQGLPFIQQEIDQIKDFLEKASIPTMVQMHATRLTALSELPKHGIVHFACHGFPANDPSESGLLLQDWKTKPLTVLDLASLNIESAQFAYLSACHSSAMRYVQLLDESINLSSEIQLCGYPAVVGNL